MKTLSTTIKALSCAVFIFALASLAQAQATRTWVSGVGDDVNPCSRTAPCKTYAGAISKTAATGEISTLDPGGFGAVTITKSITIDGTTGAGFGSILASGTNGVNINDSATATPGTIIVVLRSLSINGAGSLSGLRGVSITSARNVSIENCQIFGFRGNPGHAIVDSRNIASSPAPQLWVRDTQIFNNSGSAVNLVGGAANIGGLRAFFDNVRIDGNLSHGIQAQNSTVVHLTNSRVVGNLGDGVRAETSARIQVIGTILNGNLNGVNNVAGTVHLAYSTIMNNGSGVAGLAVVTFGTNNVRDNGAGNTLPASVGRQ